MQYIVLFSHLTVQLPIKKHKLKNQNLIIKKKNIPSVVLSQKHELAVCKPAPFFCIITQVTIYLNGLFNFVKLFKHVSTTVDVH
jgi:hypothetical protein